MDFYKALYAFYHTLVQKDCDHPRVHTGHPASFCPDCGYKVHLLWLLIKCSKCKAKRIPKKTPDGRVEPLHKYCRHCGSIDFRLVKQPTIEAHDLLYGVSLKEINYQEDPQPLPQKTADPLQPRVARTLDIVEGQVVRKRYVEESFTSAWEQSPFDWQKGRAKSPHTSFGLHGLT